MLGRQLAPPAAFKKRLEGPLPYRETVKKQTVVERDDIRAQAAATRRRPFPLSFWTTLPDGTIPTIEYMLTRGVSYTGELFQRYLYTAIAADQTIPNEYRGVTLQANL